MLADAHTGSELATSEWNGFVTDAHWSADGSAVVMRTWDSIASSSTLVVLTADGNAIDLNSTAGASGGSRAHLSADGSRVFWVQSDQLWLANADGSNAAAVANAESLFYMAPTGTVGLACSCTACSVVTPDGTVTPASQPLSTGSVAWAADGATVFRHESGSKTVFAIDTTTGDVTTIATPTGSSGLYPSPDGQWVGAHSAYNMPWQAYPRDGGTAVSLTTTAQWM